MAERRYYWLKLPEDFFRRGYIRRLRGLPDGDRLTLIYLEMLLTGLKTDGALAADGAEDFAEELALELYEEPAEVRTVLEYLFARGKMTRENESEYLLTDCKEMTGSEGSSAKRMRELRRREDDGAAPEERADAFSHVGSEEGPRPFRDSAVIFAPGHIPVPRMGTRLPAED